MRLNIALINNMPDAALEDTELQFFDLLDDASGDLPVLPEALLADRNSRGPIADSSI